MGDLQFLNPWAFTGMIAVPMVIILYFLRLRRREKVVPSTLLWKTALHDLRANTPLQRLRASLILILQLLAIILIVFAMARPAIRYASSASGRTLIMIDTSASMATADAGQGGVSPRFEEAIRDVRLRIDAMRGDESMMILAFDDGIHANTDGFLSSRSELNRFLDTLDVRDFPTHFGKALDQAVTRTRAAGKSVWRNEELVVLSDGVFGMVDQSAFSGTLPPQTTFISYGRPVTRNIGITAAHVRRRPPPPGKKRGGNLITFKVENFTDQTQEVALRLFRIEAGVSGGELIGTRTLVLAASADATAKNSGATDGESARYAEFELTSGAAGLYEARLLIDDGFETDNRVLVTVPELAGIQALYVGDATMDPNRPNAMEHPILMAMKAVRDITVSTMSGQAYMKNPPPFNQYDVVVFNNVHPDSVSHGAYLFINVVPPLPGFKENRDASGQPIVVNHVNIVDWDNTHPVMYFSKYRKITILKAKSVSVPDSARPLLLAAHGPVIVSMDNDTIRAVATFFDPLQSDWSLRMELPLFIMNAVEWLSQASVRLRGMQIRPGDPLEILPVPGAQPGATRNVVITQPDGSEKRLENIPRDAPVTAFPAEHVGLYRAEGPGTDQLWCANLLSRAESDNAARTAVRVDAAMLNSAPAAVLRRHEIRNVFLFVLMGVLFLEWFLYHRQIGV